MTESTDTTVEEKDEAVVSEAVTVDTDGFGVSAISEEVVPVSRNSW